MLARYAGAAELMADTVVTFTSHDLDRVLAKITRQPEPLALVA